MTVGAVPTPEVTVSDACDQPDPDTAGKVADWGPTSVSVSSASIRMEPPLAGRKNRRSLPLRRAIRALTPVDPDSAIVGAVRSAATVTGSGVVPVVVQGPTTAVTT